jgi:cbb3-type cytochrome oxidase subunit 3
VLFLGIVAWAWSRRRRDDFAAAASLALLEDTIRELQS